MLTDMQRALAIKIMLDTHDPEKFGAVDDRLCRKYPNITTEDLIALWREAGARQMAEADALEARAHGS